MARVIETTRDAQGRELAVMDRAGGLSGYVRSRRWIVWDTERQVTVSEHATRRAAMSALVGVAR